MSERLRGSSHEINIPPESKEQQKRLEKHHEQEAIKAEKEQQKNSIENILEKIETEAKSSETLRSKQLDNNKHVDAGPITIGAELRKRARDEGIKNIQSKLPARDRAFSKIIHQPIISAISEGTSKTIARPSGLLMGGFLSAVSSLAVLTICRYYGYRYNFLIGLTAFAGGFVLGIIIEGLLALASRNKTAP